VRVVVSEGAVQLAPRRGGGSVILRPGDVGTVSAGGGVVASRGAATPDDMAWTSGRLVFRNASVGELSADLRRWYGVELRVTDSALLRRHFTGSFTGEPSNRVIDVIALAFGARAERRGDTVFIRTSSRR
jgi:transmembrane sensor